MKHLFLEGPIQTGKSTLIRKVLGECLKEHDDLKVAGFQSQRITDEKGDTVAFRIGPAPETGLTVPACELAINPESDSDCLAGCVFKAFASGKTRKFREVFEKQGVELLKKSAATAPHVILLDEIGGEELLCEGFREELYRVLGGETLCIGVIKAEASALRMSRGKDDIVRLSRQLKADFGDKLSIADYKSLADSRRVGAMLKDAIEKGYGLRKEQENEG